MRLTPTALAGVMVVDVEPVEDDRGFFARTFDREQFLAAGLEPAVTQCSIAGNARAGTIRGMHLQVAPSAEAKLVRCSRGAVLNVVIDVRQQSETYLQSVSVELSQSNHRALYVPPQLAHGYQTLVDDTELTYQMSDVHAVAQERGLRHDDPVLRLSWPLPVTAISAKDRSWPLLSGLPGLSE